MWLFGTAASRYSAHHSRRSAVLQGKASVYAFVGIELDLSSSDSRCCAHESRAQQSCRQTSKADTKSHRCLCRGWITMPLSSAASRHRPHYSKCLAVLQDVFGFQDISGSSAPALDQEVQPHQHNLAPCVSKRMGFHSQQVWHPPLRSLSGPADIQVQ
jgi:hypothetical protein